MQIKAMYIGAKKVAVICVGRRKRPLAGGPPVVLRIFNMKGE